MYMYFVTYQSNSEAKEWKIADYFCLIWMERCFAMIKPFHEGLYWRCKCGGGALAKYQNEYLYRAEFSAEETRRMIAVAREICGTDCEITLTR